MHVPKDFVGLGTQLQLFAMALSIFFVSKSLFTEKLNYLLLLDGRNKKALCKQIAFNKFVAATFLFPVDQRVQRWLSLCKQVSFSCTQVIDNILEFEVLLEQVLNGVFNLNLPAAFKKIKNPTKTAAVNENKQAAAGNNEKGNGGNRRKRKNENGNGNLVKNKTQVKDFVPKEGETWKDIFSKHFLQDRPTWDGKVKMCARWHIKGDCYDNSARVISHVTKDKIPADKKAGLLTFMKKCRGAAKMSN